ncbi:MAG: cell division protein FtsQ [Solirubrobacterales bacterium]|nr:cell division protein FtsQ [Solirubrobacterales bacterium]
MARAYAARAGARPRRAAKPRARKASAKRVTPHGRWRRRAVALVLLTMTLAAGYLFWLRDSSLVAVNRLEITGVSGPDSNRVRGALAQVARNMTTLHVKQGELAAAVRPFPIVKSVSAETHFPSGLTIRVEQQKPVLVVQSGGALIAAAADGTLLRGVPAQSGIPRLRLPTAPRGNRLQGGALAQAVVLGAAPAPLRRYAIASSIVAETIQVRLRNGPELRFGDASRAAAKWAAVAKILADPRVGQVAYIDVSAPHRPAVGGIVQGISPSTPTAATYSP